VDGVLPQVAAEMRRGRDRPQGKQCFRCGEASDSRNFEVLLDLGPDVDPRAVVADKDYDAKTNREGGA
jgi:hypothetical protein